LNLYGHLTGQQFISYFSSLRGGNTGLLDEKMKASVVMIAAVVAMFIFESISRSVPDYKSIGYLSLMHYYNPADILLRGDVDGVVVLLAVIVETLVFAMLYFEHRDIAIS